MQSRWLGTVSYEEGLAEQDRTLQAVLNGSSPEQVLHLEHQPVYTIGRTRDQSSLQQQDSLPYPVHIISRGGQATYHGPGQLVSYPIIRLDQRGKDLHAYLRALETALIHTCEELQVPATRREGLTGIWVENRKLASIGVAVRRWVSMHGLAINITNKSMEGFRWITPCGLNGVSMTTLEAEQPANSPPQTPKSFSQLLHPHLKTALQNLTS